MEGQNIELLKTDVKPLAPKTTARGLTRREFIKRGAEFLVGGVLTVKALEKAFFEILYNGIKNPQINDAVITTSLKLSEQEPGKENPDFRPMAEIIKEGLDYFQEKSEIKPFYQRNKNYKNAEYFADSIKKFTEIRLLPQSISRASAALTASLPMGGPFEAYNQASGSNGSYEEIFSLQSGLDERFRERHPELIHKSGMYLKNTKLAELMEEEGRKEITEVIQKVEIKSKELNQPVSTSFILGHFLEKNKGNIGQSIYDTTLFLKFMARNKPDDGTFSATVENVNWYDRNIKDEYQGPVFTNPPAGERAINLIGKPYHSWNLAALLQFVPVEVVRIGGVRRQIVTFSEQGMGKTRADIQTLKDLRKIEQLLLSYSK